MNQQPPAIPDEFVRSTERAADYTQETAKWLIGALAALAAALLAGTQFSGIGRLSLDAGRLWVAVGALFVALGSVGWATAAVLRVLAGSPIGSWTPTDLERLSDDEVRYAHECDLLKGFSTSEEWFAAGRVLLREYGRLQDRHHPDLFLPRHLDRYEVLHDLRGELQVRQRDVERLAALIGYYRLRRRFSTAVRRVLAAGVVAVVSIVVLAWAANPPLPEAPTPPLISDPLSYDESAVP